MSSESISLSPYPPDFLAILPDLRAHAVRSVRAAKQEYAEILERSESIARAVGDTAWLETIVQDRHRLDEALDPLIPWIETADFENYAVCRWLDRGNRKLEEMLEGMPRLVLGIKQLQEEKHRLCAELQDVWVLASKLCPDKGISLKRARNFCEKQNIRFRNPSKQRLEIHAGDWTKYWAGKDAAAFERLDQGGRPSVFGSEDIVLDGAAERWMQLQSKRRARK